MGKKLRNLAKICQKFQPKSIFLKEKLGLEVGDIPGDILGDIPGDFPRRGYSTIFWGYSLYTESNKLLYCLTIYCYLLFTIYYLYSTIHKFNYKNGFKTEKLVTSVLFKASKWKIFLQFLL